jgi:uncharacterized protein YjfI (DUF2170 family)
MNFDEDDRVRFILPIQIISVVWFQLRQLNHMFGSLSTTSTLRRPRSILLCVRQLKLKLLDATRNVA